VEDGAHDAFLEAFTKAAIAMRIGAGTEENVDIGPLAHSRRIEAMRDLIADAVALGATVHLGGRRVGNVGNFFESTILCDVPMSARVMNEEPFGPLAMVNRFSDLEEAIAEANRLPYGLAAYAYTRSLDTARRLSREIECGKLSINTPVAPFPETPLGGVKDSGQGVEGGPEALAGYQNTKFVTFA
jgi:succinate-semialdehyde dehydrogenase/glutarate-semialdehyde dehydrogenase